MGYNTEFTGVIELDPPLNEDEASYLHDLAGMAVTADVAVAAGMPDSRCAWDADKWGDLVWNGDRRTWCHAEWLAWLLRHLFGPEAKTYVEQRAAEDPRLGSFTCDHSADGTVYAEDEDGTLWRIVVEDGEVFVEQGEVVYTRTGGAL